MKPKGREWEYRLGQAVRSKEWTVSRHVVGDKYGTQENVEKFPPDTPMEEIDAFVEEHKRYSQEQEQRIIDGEYDYAYQKRPKWSKSRDNYEILRRNKNGNLAKIGTATSCANAIEIVTALNREGKKK